MSSRHAVVQFDHLSSSSFCFAVWQLKDGEDRMIAERLVEIFRHVRLRDFHDRSLSRGQSSPDALGRRAGVIPFRFFAACMLASRPWFLFQIEPDFHLLSQTSEWSSQKIEFVFSCQSRN